MQSAFIYCSQLSFRAEADAVRTIASASRERNERDGISGLLLFDGWNFMQLIEGPAEATAALQVRLRADKRHVDFDLLVETRVEDRRCPDWRMGYLHLAQARTIESMRKRRGADALAAFDALSAALDYSTADLA